jgi:hypothetical protein
MSPTLKTCHTESNLETDPNENDGVHDGENDLGLVTTNCLGSVVACNCMFRLSSY